MKTKIAENQIKNQIVEFNKTYSKCKQNNNFPQHHHLIPSIIIMEIIIQNKVVRYLSFNLSQ